MEFTTQQLTDWKAYERVRQGGRFNMFDPKARSASGLGAAAYTFVMTHYSELKKQFLEKSSTGRA